LPWLRQLVAFESGHRAAFLKANSGGPIVGVRNLAAHEIVKLDREDVKRYGGMWPEDALRALFRINCVTRGLYDRINARILALLDDVPPGEP
jgi:hypothetical protein